MKQEYITASDVATVLGVNRQTVINYIKNGELKGRKMGNVFYVNKRYFVSVMPQAKDLASLKQELETVNDNLRKTISERRAELNNYEDDASWLHFLRSNKVNRELLTTIFRSLGEHCLSERELNIVCKVAEGCTNTEIGGAYNLSRERVRTIFEKAMRKIRELTSYSTIIDENDFLRKKIGIIKDSYNELLKENERILATAGKEKDAREKLNITDDEIAMAEELSSPVRELPLPQRLINCLIHGGFETLADIVVVEKTDFLKIKSLGKKSISQLDDYLFSMYLNFGTPQKDVDTLMKKYTLYLAMKDDEDK